MASFSEITTRLGDAVEAINALNQTLSTAFPLSTLTGSATYDPPNLVAGAQTSTSVTVTGAIMGQFVVMSFSLDLQLIQLTGYVSAPNTVTCVFRNGTAGAIDLASGTLAARVFG